MDSEYQHGNEAIHSHTDFEYGLQKAFNELRDKEFVYGCFFHYCYCLRKYIQRIGLMKYYHKRKAKGYGDKGMC